MSQEPLLDREQLGVDPRHREGAGLRVPGKKSENANATSVVAGPPEPARPPSPEITPPPGNHEERRRDGNLMLAVLLAAFILAFGTACLCVATFFKLGIQRGSYAPVDTDVYREIQVNETSALLLMRPRTFGTCVGDPIDKTPLRWDCDAILAGGICCFNRYLAEPSDYWQRNEEFQKDIARRRQEEIMKSVISDDDDDVRKEKYQEKAKGEQDVAADAHREQFKVVNRKSEDGVVVYDQLTTWLEQVQEQQKNAAADPITFYDTITSKPLFRAPVERSWDAWIAECEKYGWPSFRDEEVVFVEDEEESQAKTASASPDADHEKIIRGTKSFVRVLPDGETVSVDGTHLGHNLPDADGNRYCINLVSIAGRA
ncbi:unnamed protein product [Amoebophrya sp. A25]|nr:unnamed protein product [Amoebophrya sp. A25]|eukprot:GSA25T00023777001.1